MRATFGGLESLLRALRAEGVAISGLEIARLQAAFACAPDLDQARLETLLRCTLIKEERHAAVFAQLFRSWLADVEHAIATAPPDQPPEVNDAPPPPPPPPDPVSAPRRWPVLLLIGLVVLGSIAMWLATKPPPPAPTPPPPPVPNRNNSPPSIHTPTASILEELPATPIREFPRWHVEVVPIEPDRPLWPWWLLLLPLLAGATAFAIWRLHHRPLRSGQAPPIGPGPTDEPLLPPPEPDRCLISAAEARMLVAGVDSFLADEPSHALDLPRTVRSTAQAAGIATLVHQKHRLPREVWLWHDQSTEGPTAELLVRDLDHALTRGGHAVRTATFFGDLETVTWANGEQVSPLVLEAHRQQALVAVFTDGVLATRRLDDAITGPRHTQTLTALANWPRVALIDCATSDSAVPALAQKFDLVRLPAAEAASFVGLHRRSVLATTSPRLLRGPLRDWAKVLALWPTGFRDADALDVHRRLDLPLPRHELTTLVAHTQAIGVGHEFAVSNRIALLQGLAEEHERAPATAKFALAPECLTARACRYWIDRCTDENERRTREQTPMTPWVDTEAQARLSMERAFVLLWTDPEAAAHELDVLSRRQRSDASSDKAPVLAATIARRLARYRAADSRAADADDAMILPWRWQDLPVTAQARLWLLGFGGGSLGSGRLRMSRPTALGLGLCVGVALFWLVAALLPRPTDAPPPTWILPELPTQGLIQRLDGDHVVAGEPANLMQLRPDTAGQQTLRWTTRVEQNRSDRWFRGTSTRLLPRPTDWPELSVGVLRATAEELDARQLANRLLDSGTVDVVVFDGNTEPWQSARTLADIVPGPAATRQGFVFLRDGQLEASALAGPNDAVAVVTGKDFASLAHQITFSAPAADVWKAACRVIGGNPRVRGRANLVTIAGGTFLRGSPVDAFELRDAYPQREVTVGPFSLWRTELTRGEYRSVMPEVAWPPEWKEPDDARLPANFVSFAMAAACCNALSRRDGLPEYYAVQDNDVRAIGRDGYRLPSEAEWEYACRARTQTHYWAGNSEEDLDRVGWYVRNTRELLQPVSTKPANPFGLVDMHGNVLEWCEDTWHSGYEGAPTDGSAWVEQKDDRRILRGGSFVDNARTASAAYRNGVRPTERSRALGFRPARTQAAIAIPAGQFQMGSPAADQDALAAERPQRLVTVQPFDLWRTELTRAEFRSVMPKDTWPAEWKEAADGLLPANHVDFLTAAHCCNALSRREGLPDYYRIDGADVRAVGGSGYRLPSEAEWEYACRAGTTTRFWSGDRPEDLGRVGWFAGNADGRVHPVGGKPANAFGLFDVHGNVFEWCEDIWHVNHEQASATGTARSGGASDYRVRRGGSYESAAPGARSGLRSDGAVVWRDAHIGFRPARSAAPERVVWIPGGRFLMGSAESDAQGFINERPQHEVTILPILMWRTELTRSEYRSVMPMDTWPAEWTEDNDGQLPANHIDFAMAARCCNALSRQDGLTAYYEVNGTEVRGLGSTGYRLPSEAEWEYACRAGTTTRYWSGDREEDLARVGWFVGNSDSRVHQVAEKPANMFGLFDVHGNVWEWCEDTWHNDYKGAPADGSAWFDSASVLRVLRGGSFRFSARDARSAFRFVDPPGWRFAGVGFRPARSVASR